MRRTLLARHAESEASVAGVVNGDPTVRCGLTPLGARQAEELGRSLAREPVELAVTSDFDRCRLTARIALAGAEVRWLELPGLGELRSGRFEGGEIAAYRTWARGARSGERAPGGGESRVDAARRFAAGVRTLLEQPERVALVVAHQVTVDYLLRAARGANPVRSVDPVPYAVSVELTAPQLARAAETLEAWAAAPDW